MKKWKLYVIGYGTVMALIYLCTWFSWLLHGQGYHALVTSWVYESTTAGLVIIFSIAARVGR